MRWAWMGLAAGVFCGTTAAAAAPSVRPELELGAGVTASTAGPSLFSATVSGRGAVDLWNWLGLGVHAIGAVEGERSSSIRAWALMPQVRVHAPWAKVQPFLEVGLGVGQLVRANFQADDSLVGTPGLTWEAGGGVRGMAGPVVITGEILFLGLGSTYDTNYRDEGRTVATGAFPCFSFLVSVGWRG